MISVPLYAKRTMMVPLYAVMAKLRGIVDRAGADAMYQECVFTHHRPHGILSKRGTNHLWCSVSR